MVRTVKIQKRKTKQDQKIARIARGQAQKVVNKQIESKIWDGKLELAGEVVDYNGILYDLLGTYSGIDSRIVQGTALNQYLGQMIKPTHLSVRFAVSNDLADTINLVTVMIMQAHPNGLFVPGATMTNILQSVGNVSSPLSPTYTSYDDRFKVLYRKTFALSQVGPNIKVFKVNIGYNKLTKITFSDAIGTIETGTLFMGVISDSSADVDPLIRAQWRLHFKDA